MQKKTITTVTKKWSLLIRGLCSQAEIHRGSGIRQNLKWTLEAGSVYLEVVFGDKRYWEKLKWSLETGGPNFKVVFGRDLTLHTWPSTAQMLNYIKTKECHQTFMIKQ